MRVVLLISVCGAGVWAAPTTVAPVTVPSTTSAPDSSSKSASATINSNVTIAANATEVDKKIFPYNNQGFGLPFPGFQGPFGNGFGLNPSFSPFPGNIYGQYPTGQNVFPQGLYSPQNQNPFFNQGPVQPAQVLGQPGQPGQSPGNSQGFPQNPLQPGQSPQVPIQQGQLPQGPYPQGQLPPGIFPQGQYPPNQFPQQQGPQNQFPQGQPPSPENGNSDNSGGSAPQNPAANNNPAANDPTQSASPPGAGGQKEQQDAPSDAQNPADQTNKPNPSGAAGQLPGQFAGGFQGYPQTLTGSPEFFRNGAPALNQNFFSPTYQFLPNGQLLPQGFDGQLLTPEVFAGQGNGPTQFNPNQAQGPQGQGQFFQNPQGGSPQNGQGPQGFFPQNGFPPGFQGGYPQVPQGVFTQGPQGAFVPNPQGGFPQGPGIAPPNQGSPSLSQNPNNPGVALQGSPTQSGGVSRQGDASQGSADNSNSPDFQNGSGTQSRGVSQGDVTINGGIVSDAPVRPLESFKLKRPIVLPVKINPDSSMKIIPPPGPNQQRPFPADQAPQPSQGSELRAPPGDLLNGVSASTTSARETEGASNAHRPATRRPDP